MHKDTVGIQLWHASPMNAADLAQVSVKKALLEGYLLLVSVCKDSLLHLHWHSEVGIAA